MWLIYDTQTKLALTLNHNPNHNINNIKNNESKKKKDYNIRSSHWHRNNCKGKLNTAILTKVVLVKCKNRTVTMPTGIIDCKSLVLLEVQGDSATTNKKA